MNFLILLLGLATLIVGGEFLVKGAVGVAKKFRLSSLVIGMTVISFGTSAPELFVSASAAMGGNPDIAIGNVIGSNIANLGLVLGLTIMIFPMAVNRNSKFIDWPMMMVASVFFYIFAQNGQITFWEGVILFMSLIAFTTYLIVNSRKKSKSETVAVSSRGVGKLTTDDEGNEIVEDYTLLSLDEVEKPEPRPFKISILFLAIGLVGLFFGSGWLLDGAVAIAKDFGMEERVIAITIVAFGTSVPELVTSCVAAFRKEKDIAIGNLIGSNIFNIMCVLGLTAMINPVNVGDEIIHSDMIWMLGITAIILPMMIIGKKMGRLKGFLLFGTYVTYILTLIITL
jgi:cation:H+ antiporter